MFHLHLHAEPVQIKVQPATATAPGIDGESEINHKPVSTTTYYSNRTRTCYWVSSGNRKHCPNMKITMTGCNTIDRCTDPGPAETIWPGQETTLTYWRRSRVVRQLERRHREKVQWEGGGWTGRGEGGEIFLLTISGLCSFSSNKTWKQKAQLRLTNDWLMTDWRQTHWWLTDWRLIYWLMTDWLIDWWLMTDWWLTDYWFTDYWLNEEFLTDWLTEWWLIS